MIQPNIQEKKLNIIEQLIIINDDKVFDKVEKIINDSLNRPLAKKLTKKDLIDRAKKSNFDIENGDVFAQSEVESISQNW